MNEALPVRIRPTARIIVLDPADRILLFHAMLGHSLEPDRRPDATGYWALPGGGIEHGETAEAAARRELAEETGIQAAEPLPLIATRDVTYPWKGRRIRSLEHFFFVRAPSSAIDVSGWLEGDRRWMRDLGWWTLDKLTRTNDIVRPPRLAEIAFALSKGEIPAAPMVLPEQ
ncbi:MAG: NUDIX domain-containing protein [Hyphomicrobiaceae bacterium]|nr:NUDIX domain-containing protein [Hyphomicrobiaceae bacterium]